MNEPGEGFGLPQMSEREMFEMLLSEDEYMTSDEPEIAANIGEQMIHMGLRPLSRTIRSKIRDICSRIPAKNVILVGGGIGHLSAWLFDLWCSEEKSNVFFNFGLGIDTACFSGLIHVTLFVNLGRPV